MARRICPPGRGSAYGAYSVYGVVAGVEYNTVEAGRIGNGWPGHTP
ncbi:MAG: hypothetical protein KKA41_17880 [Proteobacteria bacterium]|nr:hypothetical protein [Pseudomonadota bacterium]